MTEMTRNFFESDEHYNARKNQKSNRYNEVKKRIESAYQSGDSQAELEARKELEALKYASQNVSDRRANTALQGVAFGFNDEIEAGLETIPDWISAKVDGSPASFSDIYNQNVTPKREALKQFSKDAPWESTGYDVGGGLLGLAALSRGTAAPLFLTNAANKFSKLTTMQKLGLGGAGWGALSGYGRSQGDIAEQAKGTATGAGLGATFGLGLGGLGIALNKMSQPVLGMFRSESTPAQRMILNTLQKGGISKEQAIAELQKMGKQSTIADLTQGTQDLAGSAVRFSPSAAEKGVKVMKGRVETGAQRLKEGLKTIFKGEKNAMMNIKAIEEARRVQASPLYQQAHNELLVIDDELWPLMKKAGASVYSNAKKIYNTDPDAPTGVVWPKFNELAEGKNIPLAIVDYMKRALSGRSSSTNSALANAQNNLGKKLTDALNSRSDAYNQGRKIYSDQSSILDAAKRGLNVLKEDADDVADDIARMSQAELEAFRISAISAIDKQLKGTVAGSDASRRVIRTEILRERLKNAFPDEKSFNDFMKMAEIENTFATTKNTVISNSETARRLASDARFVKEQGVGIATDIANGNIGNAAKNIIGLAKSKSVPLESLADEVGKIVFAQGDDAIRLISEVHKHANKISPAQLKAIETGIRRSLGLGGGAQTERAREKAGY